MLILKEEYVGEIKQLEEEETRKLLIELFESKGDLKSK